MRSRRQKCMLRPVRAGVWCRSPSLVVVSAALGALAVALQVWAPVEEAIRAALWVLLITCVIVVVWGGRLNLGLAEPSVSLPLPAVALAGVVGVGARLWLAAAFHGNFDQNSFETTAGTLARGGNI